MGCDNQKSKILNTTNYNELVCSIKNENKNLIKTYFDNCHEILFIDNNKLNTYNELNISDSKFYYKDIISFSSNIIPYLSSNTFQNNNLVKFNDIKKNIYELYFYCKENDYSSYNNLKNTILENIDNINLSFTAKDTTSIYSNTNYLSFNNVGNNYVCDVKNKKNTYNSYNTNNNYKSSINQSLNAKENISPMMYHNNNILEDVKKFSSPYSNYSVNNNINNLDNPVNKSTSDTHLEYTNDNLTNKINSNNKNIDKIHQTNNYLELHNNKNNNSHQYVDCKSGDSDYISMYENNLTNRLSTINKERYYNYNDNKLNLTSGIKSDIINSKENKLHFSNPINNNILISSNNNSNNQTLENNREQNKNRKTFNGLIRPIDINNSKYFNNMSINIKNRKSSFASNINNISDNNLLIQLEEQRKILLEKSNKLKNKKLQRNV